MPVVCDPRLVAFIVRFRDVGPFVVLSTVRGEAGIPFPRDEHGLGDSTDALQDAPFILNLLLEALERRGVAPSSLGPPRFEELLSVKILNM